jgi:aminotransferase
MGIFYRVPITGVAWDRREFREVIGSLFVRPGEYAAHELTACIEQHYAGQAVLVNSGRSALELALHRLRQRTQKHQATVLTPSLICRAVPDKIVAAGLTPVFYDLSNDLSPSIESLNDAIRPDTIAVVFAYLYGKVVPVENVAMICKNAGIALIEDCAATFLLPDGQGHLSGTSGDYVIFSFQRGKTTVAGGGGALVDRTGMRDPYDVGNWTPRELRKLYFSKVTFMLEEVFLRTGYIVQRTIGLPADFGRSTMGQVRTMSPLDCSLVSIQMKKWPSIFDAKTRVLQRYKSNLAGCPHLQLPQLMKGGFANRIFVRFCRPIASRTAPYEWTSFVADYMRKQGIEVHVPYFPVHRMPEFVQYSSHKLPVTDEAYESLLEIPSQPSLRDDEVDYVSEALLNASELARGRASHAV